MQIGEVNMRWRKLIFKMTMLCFAVVIILFLYKRWYISLHFEPFKITLKKPMLVPISERSHPYKYYRNFYSTCGPVFEHIPEQKYNNIDNQSGRQKIIIGSLQPPASLILNAKVIYKGPKSVKFKNSFTECLDVTLEDKNGVIKQNDYEIKWKEIQKYIDEEEVEDIVVIKATRYDLKDTSKLEPIAGLKMRGEILLKGNKVFEVNNVYKLICVIDLRCMNPVYENGELLEERYREKIDRVVNETEIEFTIKEETKEKWIKEKEKEADLAKKEGNMRKYYRIKAQILQEKGAYLEAIEYLKKALNEKITKPEGWFEESYSHLPANVFYGPENQGIIIDLAMNYYKLCNFEEAIKWFEKFAGYGPSEKSTWYLFRDRAYIGVGREKELLERQIRLGIPEEKAKEYIERLKFRLNEQIKECKQKGYIQ